MMKWVYQIDQGFVSYILLALRKKNKFEIDIRY